MSDDFDPQFARRLTLPLQEALADSRVVLVNGPRQTGKTTLVRSLAGPDRQYVTLDDQLSLTFARTDPVGFVRALGPCIIDEVQRVPDLFLAIKQIVDQSRAPGQFVLTGSADVMQLPRVQDSLAGRISVQTLLPLAQCEIAGTQGGFVDWVFDGGAVPTDQAPVVSGDIEARALTGGYPEAVLRPTVARRQRWLGAHLSAVLDRDVRDIASVGQLDQLPRMLAHLAEQAGQLVDQTGLGTALGLSRPTVQKYLTVLERLFLVRRLAPWTSNRIARVVKTPKLQFLDTGVLAHLRGDSAELWARDRVRFGPVLESFVVAEVLRLMSWSQTRVHAYHFRTHGNDEVDLVLEDSRGRIVGIEVKASATLSPRDFKGLRKLKEAAGDRFVRGLLLHPHERVQAADLDIHAAPVSLLWTSQSR